MGPSSEPGTPTSDSVRRDKPRLEVATRLKRHDRRIHEGMDVAENVSGVPAGMLRTKAAAARVMNVRNEQTSVSAMIFERLRQWLGGLVPPRARAGTCALPYPTVSPLPRAFEGQSLARGTPQTTPKPRRDGLREGE